MAMLTAQSQLSEQTDCYVEILSIEKFKYDSKQGVVNGEFLVRCGDNKEKYFVVLNSKDGLKSIFRAHYGRFHDEKKYTLDDENLLQQHKGTLLEAALMYELSMQPIQEKLKAIDDSGLVRTYSQRVAR